MRIMKTYLVLAILTLFNAGCQDDFTGSYPYNPPVNLADGFDVGTLDEVEIDTQMILNASGRIWQGKYGEIHSMLIYRHNRLVFEEYFQGHKFKWDGPYYYGEFIQWKESDLHQVMSCTKSFTSACIGIAIEAGYIGDVNQSIFEYLPDHQQYKKDGKERITIEHLLTMTSGLEWNEWNAPHATAANDIDRLYIECSEDPVACVLERPLVSEPGNSFTYNGGGMIILGEILRNATNMYIDEFASEHIFEPLGIDSFQWHSFPNGELEAAGGLIIKPRDMMKFGVMYLNGGSWNGNGIISNSWVEKSSNQYRNNEKIRIPIEDSGKNGYGYSWWLSEVGKGGNKTKMFRANGWGGQVILVLPEKDMVVVFTGGNYSTRSGIFEILERFILPAIND